MRIELENLFTQKLKTGINLFTGAGFSVLPSMSKEKLPTGSELCEEVKKRFGLENILSEKGLAYISEFCPEREYQEFLRDRFTVNTYNPLYDEINKINMRTYVTTNIDNIIRLVMDRSEKYYLKSIREYGASMNGANELAFIPLHGDVSNPESKLYFGIFDLAMADKGNGDLFDQMFGYLAKQPILFWGYSFQDKGVLSTIKRLIDLGTNDIWIQFLPDEKDSIELFRSKRCHIIEADTESLLKWIQKNISSEKDTNENNLITDDRLKQYRIPTLSEVASIPQTEFYQQGNTGWHPILADVPYERQLIAEMENAAIKEKNIVLTGCHFSGKTTALMQLARKVNARNKFYVDGIFKAEADFILNIIGKEPAWVFFNNFADDILAYNSFAKKDSITIIGVAEEYRFETVRHLMDREISYKVFDCSEISKEEARCIYDKFPAGLRQTAFKYKESDDEKFSMLELIAQNIVGVFAKRHISKMLKTIARESEDLFTVIVLASYLSEHGSALSYANLASVLGIDVYPDAVKLIEKTKEYLRTYDFHLDIDEYSQDFFVLRSKLFALNARNVLIEEYKEEFAKIVKKFILRESQYSIVRYNVFRRKAYDAGLFSKLFSQDEAVAIYNALYDKERSPYTLQQLALCLSNYGNFNDAFIQIDKAMSEMPNNFSFRNSQAIIMFEANKALYSNEAVYHMRMAMETLRQCYADDKRKVYHAQKFSEFAIYFYERLKCVDYLEDAWNWLVEMTTQGESSSRYTNRLKAKLSAIRAKL